MKKSGIILFVFMLFAGLTASAQIQQGMNQKQEQQKRMQQEFMQHNMQGNMQENRMGMMQGNMMQGGMCPMCGNMMDQEMPMQKYMMMVNRLPDMEEQLSLSQDQVEKLIDMRANYKKQPIDLRAVLAKKQRNMQGLMKSNASADEVRKQMKDCADIQINEKVAAYETAGKMKALLTDEQKAKLQTLMDKQAEMMQDEMMPENMRNK